MAEYQTGAPVTIQPFTVGGPATVQPFTSGGGVEVRTAVSSGEPLLVAHLADQTPHPVYDDIASLKLIYENGLV